MNTSEFGMPASYTLREFTTCLGNAIRMCPTLQNAWVRAELSDVRMSGGHCYMELVEKDASGATVAKLRANIWSSRLQQLRGKFYGATGRDIATGMKVLVNGSATHHTVYGVSFNIFDIDPSYTLGDMERLRREILARLAKEGVIGFNRALSMPAAPQRIAVVSAAGAAGYGDFINQLESSAEGFVFYPALFPAVMQGERTSESVRAALDLIEMSVDFWDCVVIIRGGGSTSDLNGFDDYELARRVATYPLPVVVGIGHERDRTVLDEIANTRLKTPTAVAAFFIDALRNAYGRVSDTVDTLVRFAVDRLNGEKRRIDNCETMIPAVVGGRLTSAGHYLGGVAARIPLAVNSRILSENQRLTGYGRLLGSLSAGIVGNASGKLAEMSSRLDAFARLALRRASDRLDNYVMLVNALSPENTLRRGYTITTCGGKAVKDASSLKRGNVITTRFADGEVESVVEEQSGFKNS